MRRRMDGCMFSAGMSCGSVQAMSVLSESMTEVPADESGGEAQRKLLPDFAVGVGHHMVRVGVDADQAGDFDVESGFLLHFTHRGIDDRFAQLHPAARQCPQVVVAASDQHDAILVVGHDSGGGGHHTVGGRRVGIVVVVGSGHLVLPGRRRGGVMSRFGRGGRCSRPVRRRPGGRATTRVRRRV